RNKDKDGAGIADERCPARPRLVHVERTLPPPGHDVTEDHRDEPMVVLRCLACEGDGSISKLADRRGHGLELDPWRVPFPGFLELLCFLAIDVEMDKPWVIPRDESAEGYGAVTHDVGVIYQHDDVRARWSRQHEVLLRQ